MSLKDYCKLASVLETQVLYKSWGLKTRFLLAELETFMPYRSRVLTVEFKKTWILSFLHSISNREQKMYKPRKRRKNPKKKKKKTRKKKKKKEPRRKKERKKKIQSKKEDPRHTQIQSPSSTSRSSIYGTIHELYYRANYLNKLHTTLKDVNDLKEKAMGERWTRLRLFVNFSTKTASASLMPMWALLAFCCLSFY